MDRTPPTRSVIRTFVALNLPLEVLGELAEVQRSLRSLAKQAELRLSWVPAANMHVTLKFLGDIPLEASYAIRDRLERELAGRESFALSLGGLGVFPDERRPRVLWVGVDDGGGEPGPLTQLAADVEGWLDDLGFEPDAPGFHAHVTLGRFKRGSVGDDFWKRVEAPAVATRATEVAFYQSELTSSGAEYKALGRCPLVFEAEPSAEGGEEREGESGEEQAPSDIAHETQETTEKSDSDKTDSDKSDSDKSDSDKSDSES